MMLTGYDLADYQTVGQGTDRAFGIVKASEGKGGRTTRHDAHVTALRAAGRLVGHYHFAWPVNGGQADAANFLAAAKPVPGDVLALDWEPYGPSGVGVTPAMAFPYVRDFATVVRAATGAWPWFYTNDDQLTKIRAAVSASDWAWLTSTLPLWKAGVNGLYVSDPAKGPGSTYGFVRVAAFQWSSTPIDQDVFYGDAALWRALGVPEETTVAKTTYRGVTVDARTAKMLAAVNELLPTIPFWPSQGSYNTSVTASGGTHSGGGAVDIALFVDGRTLTDAEARQIETAGRRVGFAAYYRPAIPGTWPRHVHMIAIGQPDMSIEASYQVRDYKAGKDGLLPRSPSTGLSLNPDTGSRAYVNATWEGYVPPPKPKPDPIITQENDMLPRIITALGNDNSTGADDYLVLFTGDGRFIGLSTADMVATAVRYVQFAGKASDQALYQSEIQKMKALLDTDSTAQPVRLSALPTALRSEVAQVIYGPQDAGYDSDHAAAGVPAIGPVA